MILYLLSLSPKIELQSIICYSVYSIAFYSISVYTQKKCIEEYRMNVKFYTIEEVADILRVNPATVRKLIDTGELKATRVGRQYRISQEQLDDYIQRHS